MNKLHYKAIRKGVIIWDRYSRFCRSIDPLWRADLWGADLQDADLRAADLHGADLWRADLRNADLCEANLYGADLTCADLCGANMRGADLRGAKLREADLRGVDMRGANLCGAGVVADVAGYRILAWPGGARVGCHVLALAGWQAMTPEEAEEIDDGGGAWWRQYGPVVLSMIARMGKEVKK